MLTVKIWRLQSYLEGAFVAAWWLHCTSVKPLDSHDTIVFCKVQTVTHIQRLSRFVHVLLFCSNGRRFCSMKKKEKNHIGENIISQESDILKKHCLNCFSIGLHYKLTTPRTFNINEKENVWCVQENYLVNFKYCSC